MQQRAAGSSRYVCRAGSATMRTSGDPGQTRVQAHRTHRSRGPRALKRRRTRRTLNSMAESFVPGQVTVAHLPCCCDYGHQLSIVMSACATLSAGVSWRASELRLRAAASCAHECGRRFAGDCCVCAALTRAHLHILQLLLWMRKNPSTQKCPKISA